MSVQISTPCLPTTSICSGDYGCGSDTSMVAVARIMPIFTGEEWDSARAYGALEVVEQPDGTMFITKCPTPAATPLDDCRFWGVYNENMWKALEKEATARKEADEGLNAKADALGERLAQEAQERIAADASLGSRIDEEATARKNADASLESTLTGEIDQVMSALEERIATIPIINSIQPGEVNAEPYGYELSTSVLIGAGARAGSSSSAGSNVAVGANASIAYDRSVAIGYQANCSEASVSIGASAKADVADAVAIGYQADCSDASVSIGANASAAGHSAVALGSSAMALEPYTVSVGNEEATRRIINVSDPVDDQDAATKAYVDGANQLVSHKIELTEMGNAQSSETIVAVKRLQVALFERRVASCWLRESALSSELLNLSSYYGELGQTLFLNFASVYVDNDKILQRAAKFAYRRGNDDEITLAVLQELSAGGYTSLTTTEYAPTIFWCELPATPE